MAGETPLLGRIDRAQRARERWGLNDPLAGIEFDGVDLISEFLDEIRLIGRSEDTVSNYKRVLGDFQNFLNRERGGIHIGKASPDDALLWKKHLDDRGIALTTKVTCLILLSRFFQFLVDSPLYPHQTNPVKTVRASVRLPKTTPKRREVTVEEMADFVRFVTQPRDRALIVLLLKTGMRRGELANLRLKHVSLGKDDMEDKAVGLKPQSVLIEEGVPGTKRKRDTLIPIDEECVRALRFYLSTRPDDATTDQLFLQLSLRGEMDPQHLSYVVRDWTRQYGWWKSGATLKTNVSAHFTRHFFTTQMRIRGMPDALISYIRGDSARDIKDVYTHFESNWEWIRDTYNAYVYKFGI